MGTRAAATAIAAALLLAACSDDGESAATVPPTDAPTTTTSTTVAPTTTLAPTTTEAATTTTEALPVPEPAPDPNTREPKHELGILEIPKLGVTKTLYEGVALPTLDNGPGHWPGTAMPGHLGNVVIGGHRTSKDRPFRHIDQLVPGDEVVLSTLEGRYVYRVVRTEVVLPDAIWIIDQARSYTATLFACHPVGSTKERIVVFLELDHTATT